MAFSVLADRVGEAGGLRLVFDIVVRGGELVDEQVASEASERAEDDFGDTGETEGTDAEPDDAEKAKVAGEGEGCEKQKFDGAGDDSGAGTAGAVGFIIVFKTADDLGAPSDLVNPVADEAADEVTESVGKGGARGTTDEDGEDGADETGDADNEAESVGGGAVVTFVDGVAQRITDDGRDDAGAGQNDPMPTEIAEEGGGEDSDDTGKGGEGIEPASGAMNAVSIEDEGVDAVFGGEGLVVRDVGGAGCHDVFREAGIKVDDGLFAGVVATGGIVAARTEMAETKESTEETAWATKSRPTVETAMKTTRPTETGSTHSRARSAEAAGTSAVTPSGASETKRHI